MISKNWKDKLSINYVDTLEEDISVKNSFGLLFAELNTEIIIYFIPLNESLSLDRLESYNYDHLYLLKFDRELIEEDDVEYALDILNLFNLTRDQSLRISLQFWKELDAILGILKKEYHRQDGSYLIIKSTLKILLLHLIRFQQQDFLDQDLQQKRIYSFLQHMELNYQQHTDSQFYAQHIGISNKRLNQIIKEKLGKTAKQIIQERRLTEIKREIQNSNKTLKEIAFMYNFNSAVSFSRFFKRKTGLSALEFRNNNTHKK